MATSANITNLSVLQGIAKEVYAKLVEDARVEETFFQENIEFDKRAMQGNFYHQPVAATQNVGQFFDVPDGTADMTNYPPVSMESQDAQLKGYQLADRLRVSYEALSRLQNGDSASFINEYGLKMLSLWKSAKKNYELSIMFGSRGIAQVQSILVAQSGGNITVGLDYDQCAPGMWIGSENWTLQYVQPSFGTVTYSGSSGAQTITINGQQVSFSAGGTDAASAANAAAAVNGSLATSLQVKAQVVSGAVCSLFSNDPNLAGSATTLSVTGTGATASGANFTSGGIRGSGGGKSVQVVSFVDAPVGGTPALKTSDFNGSNTSTAVAVGDVLYRSPAFGSEPLGIEYWLEKTALGAFLSSVTTANIDAAKYSVWRASAVDLLGKKLSIARLADIVSQAQDRGLAGDVTCVVCPKLYAQILGEAEGTVNKDYSYSKSEFKGGFKGITLTTYTGDIKLIPHRFMKRARAWILEMDELLQIGSTPLVDRLNGGKDVSLQLDAPQGLYSEMRLFANFNVLVKAPSHFVLIKGIGYDA